ncbi:hypothetical protein E1B28_006831 [Marasmius oreades]|uniref:DUF6532 domain-containing protein n=1 Tax=Marasmius oreades TaxID=181124 RepID=A0A9P7UWY0_9AGAR|nr:uncharacterized protein E1B28_006831 [Marasmius oreades]KAG7096158.1 hypothetical protein E1B28_006831 [Marasmius oreades]
MTRTTRRNQQAAETRASNLAREKQQEEALQREVEASGGRASKKRAGDRWLGAVTGKRRKTVSAEESSNVAETPRLSSRGNIRRMVVQDSDDECTDTSGKSPVPHDESLAGGSGEEEGVVGSDNDDLGLITPMDRNARLAAEASTLPFSLSSPHPFLNFEDDDSAEETLPPARHEHEHEYPHQYEFEMEHDDELGEHEPQSECERYVKTAPLRDHRRSASTHSSSSRLSGHTVHERSAVDGHSTRHARDQEVRRERNLNNVLRGNAHLSKHSRNHSATSQPLRQFENLTSSNKRTPKSTRQEKFENEAPVIKNMHGPSKPTKKTNTATTTTKSKLTANIPQGKEWPDCATLTLHPNGRSLRLSDQPYEVRTLVQHAIKSATIELVYCDAYPDPVDVIRKTRKILLTSVRALNHTHPMQGFQLIKERIKSPDHGFTDTLGKVVTDRFSVICGEAKDVAERCIVGYDITGIKQICRVRVDVLLTGDNYSYPGTWADGSDGTVTRTVDNRKPYASQPIIACIWGLYKRFDPHQLEQRPDIFASSIMDHPQELELPPGLVALAATAVFAVLRDWKSGEFCRQNFEGNTFNRTYKSNIEWMAASEKHNPTKYHILMHGLYQLVMNPDAEEEIEMVNTMPANAIDSIEF